MATCPSGTAPLGVSLKQLKTYGLSTGPTILDAASSGLIDKMFALDEATRLGYMSAFNQHKAAIKAYTGKQLLVVADPDRLYGENYIICLTEEAKAVQEEKIKQDEENIRATSNNVDARTSAAANTAEMLITAQTITSSNTDVFLEDKSIVVHEAALPCRTYVSSTVDATISEICLHGRFTPRSRPLLGVVVRRRRGEFGKRVILSDRTVRPAGNGGPEPTFVEFYSRKDPNYEQIFRGEQNMGSQTTDGEFGILGADASTQAPAVWAQRVNSAIQANVENFMSEQLDAALELACSKPKSRVAASSRTQHDADSSGNHSAVRIAAHLMVPLIAPEPSHSPAVRQRAPYPLIDGRRGWAAGNPMLDDSVHQIEAAISAALVMEQVEASKAAAAAIDNRDGDAVDDSTEHFDEHHGGMGRRLSLGIAGHSIDGVAPSMNTANDHRTPTLASVLALAAELATRMEGGENANMHSHHHSNIQPHYHRTSISGAADMVAGSVSQGNNLQRAAAATRRASAASVLGAEAPHGAISSSGQHALATVAAAATAVLAVGHRRASSTGDNGVIAIGGVASGASGVGSRAAGADGRAGGVGGSAGPAHSLARFLSRVYPHVTAALDENDFGIDPSQIGRALNAASAVHARLHGGDVSDDECDTTTDDAMKSGAGTARAPGKGRRGNRRGAATLHEERTFSDITLTANRAALVATAWRPHNSVANSVGLGGNASLIAAATSPAAAGSWFVVAPVQRLSLEARLAAAAIPKPAYVLLYNTSHFDTRALLEVPSDPTALHWCPYPQSSSLLAVGLVSGHVSVFDVRPALTSHATAAIETSTTRGAGASGPMRLRPLFTSHSEGGHSRAVVALRWLPPTRHLNTRQLWVDETAAATDRPATGDGAGGKSAVRAALAAVRASAPSYQFLSVSADGSVCVWDTRFRERARARRRNSGGTTGATTGKHTSGNAAGGVAAAARTAAAAAAADVADVPWMPHYRTFIRYSGAGAGASASSDDGGANAAAGGASSNIVRVSSVAIPQQDPAEPLLVGTDDGRAMAVDWTPSGETAAGIDGWAQMQSLLAAATAAAAVAAPGTSARSSGGEGATATSSGTSSTSKQPGGSGASHTDSAPPPGGWAPRVLWTTPAAAAAVSSRPTVDILRAQWEQLPLTSPLRSLSSAVFVVVNERDASLWVRGVPLPVWTLPPTPANVTLTSARWSPTRPAVLYFGRSDGTLEAWDLLASTARPTTVFPLVSCAITSLEFRPGLTSHTSASTGGAVEVIGAGGGILVSSGGGKQLLAAGDAKGALHLLDIPLALRRAGTGGSSGSDAILATSGVAGQAHEINTAPHSQLASAVADTNATRAAVAVLAEAIPAADSNSTLLARNAAGMPSTASATTAAPGGASNASEDVRFAAFLAREAARTGHVLRRAAIHAVEHASTSAAEAKAAAERETAAAREAAELDDTAGHLAADGSTTTSPMQGRRTSQARLFEPDLATHSNTARDAVAGSTNAKRRALVLAARAAFEELAGASSTTQASTGGR